MKTENDEQLRQELRLAQLEIKLLREQLHQSAQTTLHKREPAGASTTMVATKTEARPVVVAMTPNEPPSSTSAAQSHRVLYFEDSEPNFRLIESILEDRPGTNLTWAENGKKGLELAKSEKPELVLLDLDLPDMHGSKVIAELQAQSETAQTPVIVISADATPSQIERMLAAGARNYLTKPFEIRRFLCMFDEVFASA